MTGLLLLNHDRPDIALETGALYGGLHCGDCFQCFINGEWISVRLEYDADWILVCGEKAIPIPYGANVRV